MEKRNMDKRALLIFGLLAVVLVIIAIRYSQQRSGVTSADMVTVQVGEHDYTVEIADTLLSQARGLSGRSQLAEGSGMLFVFATSSIQSFWMQGMQFPLDFIWAHNGRVIGVTENVPINPQTAIIRSPGLANMVLELNAGTVAKGGINVGDDVFVDK